MELLEEEDAEVMMGTFLVLASAQTRALETQFKATPPQVHHKEGIGNKNATTQFSPFSHLLQVRPDLPHIFVSSKQVPQGKCCRARPWPCFCW